MNLADLREETYRFMGLSGANVPDHVKQQVTDDINKAQDRIYKAVPYVWWMIKAGTITPVTGTDTYTLAEDVVKPLGFWTADTRAHKIPFFSARIADRSGIRNTNLSEIDSGPFSIYWNEPTTAASSSGASGGSEGATVTEGATALTKAGGTAFASSDVGKRIYLNGEDADYIISAVGGDDSCTLDRAARGRLSGIGTTGTGAGYSQVRWEINPAGVYRVWIPQADSNGATINYRYHKKHRRLINTDETPEAPKEWHWMIASGAKMLNAAFRGNNSSHQMMEKEYVEALTYLAENETSDEDENFKDTYESPVKLSSYRSYLPPGTYFRFPKGYGH